MTVTSADEFYSIMGVLTREMLEFTDTNHLVKVRSINPLVNIRCKSFIPNGKLITFVHSIPDYCEYGTS